MGAGAPNQSRGIRMNIRNPAEEGNANGESNNMGPNSQLINKNIQLPPGLPSMPTVTQMPNSMINPNM